MSSVQAVAKKAGVSVATVSRVFNNRSCVKKEAQDKVLAAAEALGFIPRFTARRDCIVLVVESTQRYAMKAYGSMVVAGLLNRVVARGEILNLVSADDMDMIRGLAPKGVISALYRPESLEMLSKLDDLPVVTLNAKVEGLCSICSDEVEGMEIAVSHLVKHGHEAIALLNPGQPKGESMTWSAEERTRGYQMAMEKHSLKVDPAWLVEAGDRDAPVEPLAKILKHKPTAVLVVGESWSMPLLYALDLLGKKVPDDISVISYEDQENSRFMAPPQTTIQQDIDRLNEEALACLDQVVASKNKMKPVHIAVPYLFHERESVSKPS